MPQVPESSLVLRECRHSAQRGLACGANKRFNAGLQECQTAIEVIAEVVGPNFAELLGKVSVRNPASAFACNARSVCRREGGMRPACGHVSCTRPTVRLRAPFERDMHFKPHS